MVLLFMWPTLKSHEKNNKNKNNKWSQLGGKNKTHKIKETHNKIKNVP